jgi:hypothetical protein
MLNSSWSFFLRKRGGVNHMPTPAGVPVAMMSPGSSVRPADIVAISSGILKMSSL